MQWLILTAKADPKDFTVPAASQEMTSGIFYAENKKQAEVLLPPVFLGKINLNLAHQGAERGFRAAPTALPIMR